MSKMLTAIRDWLPPLGAVGVVIAAMAYTFIRASEIGANIRQMNNLATTLTATAAGVERGVLSPEETAALEARRRDLILRMQDSLKQIVPQLSEAARKAGLNILEIRPEFGKPQNSDSNRRTDYPNYRVMVQGTYQRIAEFMQGCKKQRIPVRVNAFRIARPQEQGDGNGEVLKAEITVEAFQASKAVAKTVEDV